MRIDSYFEEILKSKTETVTFDPILKTRTMYRSCMNEGMYIFQAEIKIIIAIRFLEAINQRGTQPLLDLLSELRYWPIIQKEWSESDFDLIWLLAQLRLYNNDILIGEWVAPDMNSDEYVIMVKKSIYSYNFKLPNSSRLSKLLWVYRERIITWTKIHLNI